MTVGVRGFPVDPKKAATSVTAYIHPKDTCENYLLSQGIAGRDLCASDSSSCTRFSSLGTKIHFSNSF